jgi:hypothetical protein
MRDGWEMRASLVQSSEAEDPILLHAHWQHAVEIPGWAGPAGTVQQQAFECAVCAVCIAAPLAAASQRIASRNIKEQQPVVYNSGDPDWPAR